MSKHTIIILTKLTALAALATDAGFQSVVNTLFPVYGAKIIAGIALVAALAAEVVHFMSDAEPPTPSSN